MLDGLKKTPLHPQWLVARKSQDGLDAICSILQGSVLDVGSGDRRLEKRLPPGARYIGLDYPPSGARYRTPPHVWADALRLPVRDRAFDSVALLEVLEHLPDPQPALKEAARVVRSKGLVIVTVPFLYPIHDAPYDFRRLTAYGIRHLASEAGLVVIELNERGHALETAAMLTALALSEACIRALEQRRPIALLLLSSLLAVPFINVAGYVASRLFPTDRFMPVGYAAVLRKP